MLFYCGSSWLCTSCNSRGRDRNHLSICALRMCCRVLRQESSLGGPAQGQWGWTGILCVQTTRTHGVDRQECNVCVFVWLRQGTSGCMSNLIIDHTEKILDFYLVWGSKALLVVKGSALSTLPSSSYHAGFCLVSRWKQSTKRIILRFFFFYTQQFLKLISEQAQVVLRFRCVFFLKLLSTLFISCRHRSIRVYTQSWVLGSHRQSVLRWYWAAHITLASRNLYLYITPFFGQEQHV